MAKPVNYFEQVEASGSHFEVGVAIGARFAEKIHRGYETYRILAEGKIHHYHHTPKGQARYRELLDLNRTRYPDYLAECEGIAQGAGVSFEDLFLANMRKEYAGFLRASNPHGCSDCSLVTEDVALIGHNEDNSPAIQEGTYIVHARVRGRPAFTVFTYPGYLCGNGFGFNSEGICYAIDGVRPQDVQVGCGGHFVARSLLDARSLQDAIARVTVSGRASGFSYTIGSIAERRVVQVEVAPKSHHVREIQGFNFHANHYQELTDVDQIIIPSSPACVERARTLLKDNPPLNATGVLTILGDRENEQYPIFLSKPTPQDNNVTFCTALFDLDARQFRIYTGHPIDDSEEFITFSM
jgi:predicted choloylglycine hydrolase